MNGTVATVLILVLGLVLWWTRERLRAERRWRERYFYLYVAAARAAGYSDDWISEALSLRLEFSPGTQFFLDLPSEAERAGKTEYARRLDALRAAGLSPRELRQQFRKLGWPIPPELRREHDIGQEGREDD